MIPKKVLLSLLTLFSILLVSRQGAADNTRSLQIHEELTRGNNTRVLDYSSQKDAIYEVTDKEGKDIPLTTNKFTDLFIYFDYDSASVRSESFSELIATAEALKMPPLDSSHFVIQGHTDSIGSEIYNFDLSRRRAQSVKLFLTGMGIQDDHLFISPHGEAMPIATNSTEEGRQLNRRVTVVRID